jgi:2-phospho-L-lactate guanylyltransferase
VQPSSTAWSVVVPVKRPELAKTRLRALAGVHRADLARAIAADTVAAALAAHEVGGRGRHGRRESP